MPKLLPVHYQTHPLATYCGVDVLDAGQVTIGTSDPAGVTCTPCLMTPDMAGIPPISREEYGALIRKARTSLKDAIEPLDHWLAKRSAEDEARFRRLMDLDAWYRSTPWWDLITRSYIARAISRVENQA